MKNSNRIIAPGAGRFWRSPVDTPPPFQLVTVSGAPDSATLVFTVGGEATAGVPVSPSTQDSDILAIAQAIAGLSTVGAGRVSVIPADPANPYTYILVIDPAVITQAVTVAGTFTGGTNAEVAVKTTEVVYGPWTPWTETGHTSKDSPLQINRSGGDTTTFDTWQQANVASTTAATKWALAYALLQHDFENLRQYHGSNALISANGLLGTPGENPTPTEHALLLQILNGNKVEWRHWPRVSTIAADGESWDTTKLAGLPVASTVLQSATYPVGQQISQVGAAA